MVKRLMASIFSMFLVVFLSACGSSADNQTETKQPNTQLEEADAESEEAEQKDEELEEAEPDDSTSGGGNVLVVYFSRTGEQYGVGEVEKGNTAIVADMIIEGTGADSFEILPEDDYYPYTYDELTDIAKKEQNEKARPAYAGDAPDFSGYDVIYIGSPVWWGDWPMIMYTFFEENADALAGKTLVPFSTHAGSGLSGFDSKLASVCPDSVVGEGLAIAGTDAQNNRDNVRSMVNDWLAKQGVSSVD